MSPISTILVILASMGVVALVETAIPLHARGRAGRVHVAPNLMLTFVTFATNALFGAGVIAGLFWLQVRGLGFLNAVSLPAFLNVAVVLLVLDLSFYVAHVTMHKVPALWRFHAVHHSDAHVDVTTTIRQHPGETLFRYAVLAVFAFVVGASPAAFAVYRLLQALSGLLEHANLRLPLRLDRVLALITTWPHMHKVHHSRVAAETDSNYGNLFSFWDRLFGTFTPSHRGVEIAYGLDGFDDPRMQTTSGLLVVPFQSKKGEEPRRAYAERAP
jgi:sterol desaturase/sphingolipid hydroxylase (fatty acid hydroxylase superfamily)